MPSMPRRARQRPNYRSERYGFESLRARSLTQPRPARPVGAGTFLPSPGGGRRTRISPKVDVSNWTGPTPFHRRATNERPSARREAGMTLERGLDQVIDDALVRDLAREVLK